jgi:SAM-dependent methyltransferase
MSLANAIAYRLALRTMLGNPASDARPLERFAGITDDFWFWLNTKGYRRSDALRRILPGMPDEDVQLLFTGNAGDPVLREGFEAYVLFRDAYETHAGRIADARKVLDFGCGWGRIIRFFLKDVEPSRLYGCDPVEEMIRLCEQHNKWCSFTRIGTGPPTPFEDDSFDMVYGHSVFSHLSEEMHETLLLELRRILRPGGLLVMTTRGRDFILACEKLRQRKDLGSLHAGPRSSAGAFLDTRQCLADFDSGKYCFSPLKHEWSYWGETAIPKAYVLDRWTRHFTFLDYIDDRSRCALNAIVMRKSALT